MAKFTMKRNDVKEFLREQVDRCYNGEISWDDYFAIEIEYEPLNLENYPAIKPETAKWINILFNEETADRKGNYMLRGFTHYEGKEIDFLHLSYGDYSGGLNFWAYNDEEMLLYTFCEGDTTLTLFNNPKFYKGNKAEMLRWYEKRR